MICLSQSFIPTALAQPNQNDPLSVSSSAFKWQFRLQGNVAYPLMTNYRHVYRSAPAAGASFLLERNLFPVIDAPSLANWRFSTGLSFQALHYNRNAKDSFESFIQNTRESYLHVPIGLVWSPKVLDDDASFFVHLQNAFLIEKNLSQREFDFSGNSPRDPSQSGRYSLGISAGGNLYLNKRFYIGAEIHAYPNINRSLQRAYHPGRFSQAGFTVGYRIFGRDTIIKNTIQQITIKPAIQDTTFIQTWFLVQLTSNKKTIDRYLAAGMRDQAFALQNETNALAEIEMNAIKKHITAGNFAFFYDYNAGSVVDGHYENVLFIENEQKLHNLPDTTNDAIFILKFGEVYSESFQTYSGFGLVCHDRQFNQLKEPYPFYINSYLGIFKREDLAKKFNQRWLTLFKK